MKRVILDTTIYGLLAADSNRFELVEKIKTSNLILICGFKIIREELRDTPKSIKLLDRNLRIDLLSLYDSIVEEHNLIFDEKIAKIADNYYKAYKEFGGLRKKEEILNDFMIVAAASFNNLDIIVTGDEKTMLAENALRAYNLINSIIGKGMPQFINYQKFKKLLGGKSYELF